MHMSSRGAVNIARLEVNMTVTTPDVKSFRASDDQIMQNFENNLKRSIGRVGTGLADDHPTRRVVK